MGTILYGHTRPPRNGQGFFATGSLSQDRGHREQHLRLTVIAYPSSSPLNNSNDSTNTLVPSNAPYRYILSSLPTISYTRILATDMLNHVAIDLVDHQNDDPLPPEGYTYIVPQHESVGKMFKMNRYHNRQWFTYGNAKIMVGMMLDQIAPGYPPRPMEVVGMDVAVWDGGRLVGWARLTNEDDEYPYDCEGFGKGRLKRQPRLVASILRP